MNLRPVCKTSVNGCILFFLLNFIKVPWTAAFWVNLIQIVAFLIYHQLVYKNTYNIMNIVLYRWI